RYTQLKRSWNGNLALNAYLRIFLVQAVLAWVIALPIVIVNQAEPRPLDWLALVGGLVWLIGFALEAIGDQQLRTFVSDPKHRGKLMDSGLWRYSRHPNYFGELTQWWGIFIIALSTPMGWIGFIGPLTLTILILFISGIPLNEKRQTAKLGWQEYKRRTSSLVPLPPKK
ncbi:MAG TPA: DUF1295 domain-containing protein, partial [Candidatus Saccharimonadales bacterium]|nr:DUF1295 domain-containing protein [Candidatus Saccharimonadales bacterium]